MAVRLIKFFVGLAMIQLAVATFLAVGIGSDSFTVFMQGLSKVLHISVGAGNCLLTLVILGKVLPQNPSIPVMALEFAAE